MKKCQLEKYLLGGVHCYLIGDIVSVVEHLKYSMGCGFIIISLDVESVRYLHAYPSVQCPYAGITLLVQYPIAHKLFLVGGYTMNLHDQAFSY
jgi:hypothetical protein